MGTVAFGLSQVGEALGEAKRQQREEALAQIRAQVEQQYAKTNVERLGIEREREKRLAQQSTLPAYLGHFQLPDGTFVYGTQDPKTGEVTWNKVPFGSDVSGILEGLTTGISSLPKETQAAAQSAVGGLVQMGRYKEAQNELNKYLLQYGKGQMPQQPTITTEETTQGEWVDDPENPGKQKFVQVPREVRRITGKGPIVEATTPPRAATPTAPLVRTPPAQQKKAALRPEMSAGLRVLHVSLWGTPTVPGLDSTLKVLDSGASRAKLIAAGVGRTPDPNEWAGTRMTRAALFSQLSPEEKAYAYQFNRARSAINALRTVTGLPRSTQSLMEQYATELPDPVSTPSAADGQNKLNLVEREINAALNDAVQQTGGEGGTSGLPAPISSGAVDQPGPPAPPPPSPTPGRLTPEQEQAMKRLFGK